MRAFVALALLTVPAGAVAEVRAFTETFEYATQPEGTTTVQLWHTGRRVTWDNDYSEQLEQRIQLKHGVTEHWDVTTTTILTQSGRTGLHLDRVLVGPRYRFADRAEWPVDLMLALEAGKVADRSIYPIELRLIVARDVDRLTFAANGIGLVRVGKDLVDDVEIDLGWSAGASYQLHTKVRLGAETWGHTLDEGPQPATDDLRVSAGPVLHVAPAPTFWATATAGFGLTAAADVFAVRVLLGIEL